ncbi:MAG: hypothetical protein COB23_07090 [Methylophaga sp.]|nr:MAG: hypothetical protein COB23_07090 [Methylophaga sp.]
MFEKNKISDNKNFLYIGLITLVPVGLAFNGEQSMSLATFIVSILLYKFDPSLKSLKKISATNFFYYTSIVSGILLGNLTAVIEVQVGIVDTIYYVWIFYFGFSLFYLARKLRSSWKSQ